MQEWVDHKGNVFSSKQAMCSYYNVSPSTFNERYNRGLSIEECLLREKKSGKSIVCYDHLGNKYDSIIELCERYSLTPQVYRYRVNLGWSLEDICTVPLKTKTIACKDHKGIGYESIAKMCEAYSVAPWRYNYRRRAGWTLEEALTTPIKPNNCKCQDHLGNNFESKKEMCAYWHISFKLYKRRKEDWGWDLEKTLTTPVKENRFACVDHLGNQFVSMKEMCAYWGVSYETYKRRVNNLHWSIEKALTTQGKKKKYKDHLGNEFNSLGEMLDKWGISPCVYHNRRKYSWSLKKILTTPVSRGNSKGCYDHLGNKYATLQEMCNQWGVSLDTYSHRVLDYKWTIEKALTEPVRSAHIQLTDHLGNVFNTQKEMCAYWHTNYSQFCERVNRCGWTVEQALTIERRKYKGFTLMQEIEKTGFYFCRKDGRDYVLSVADIDEGAVG